MIPKAQGLFVQALEMEGEEREAFLTKACGGDEELRLEVEGLLVDAERADALFGVTADDTAASAGCEDNPPAGIEGDQVGPYTLRQRIGEGGFGVVWMAEQHEPIARMVALKVVKAGMDTRQVLARFEAERQALAMMEHPNIARVLDAGATESGRPYFAMELVRGVPIIEFCNEQKLGLEARLALFREVCSAVNHAHQKGVIHRDLKPSNVMVTLNGDVPIPKVIDFGIAKATQSKLTEKTLFTRFEQFLGTPAYMSPEQAAMSGLDIDTRADIYSLGVLLYELLSGGPPFDPKTLISAGYDEMRRIIREEDPPRPSQRLSTMGVEDGTRIARTHGAEPRKLGRLVKGDLDWIVMKAMEKDRSRRYETANALAADLGRYLSDEPVLATPPSAAYKFRKFARRNKGAMVAGLAVAVILVAATAVSSWLAFRATSAEGKASARAEESDRARKDAEAARKEAVMERDKAIALSDLLRRMFESAIPQRHGRDVRVVEVLDEAVRRIDGSLPKYPEVEAELRGSLAAIYSLIGEYHMALRLWEELREFNEKHFEPEADETLVARIEVGRALSDLGREAEAAEAFEEVLAVCRTGAGGDRLFVITMLNLSSSRRTLGELDRAIDLARECLETCQRSDQLEDQEAEIVAAKTHLANGLAANGDKEQDDELMQEALELRQEILAWYETNRPPRDTKRLGAMWSLASSYRDVGRDKDALKLREEFTPVFVDVFGVDHPRSCGAMLHLAISRADDDQGEAALRMCKQAYEGFQASVGDGDERTLGAMDRLIQLLESNGDTEKAEALRKERNEIKERAAGPDSAIVERMKELRIDLNRTPDDDVHAAIKILEEVVALSKQAYGPEDEMTAGITNNLVMAYAYAGRHQDAIDKGAPILDLPLAENWSNPIVSSAFLFALQKSYRALGREKEAADLDVRIKKVLALEAGLPQENE